MRVEWTDDQRPNPDNAPLGMSELAFDDSLIYQRAGEVVSSSKSFWFGWQFLVICDDGKLREVDADQCQAVLVKAGATQ